MKSGGFKPETVTVASTSTLVVEVDVRNSQRFALYVENLDPAQTFAGTLERYMVSGQTPAPSSQPDLSAVEPGEAVMADIDTSCTAYLRLVGTMSGAGGDVSVSGADR